MIMNVLVDTNPWPARSTGPAMMKSIPNAPSKGIQLNADQIRNALMGGCERSRNQLQAITQGAQG